MQRKAYVPGTAALLALLLAGCSGGSGDGGSTDDSHPGPSETAASAEPGRYRTLPEPCTAASADTLASLLPGLGKITDEERRQKAARGTPILTYDTDRKVGCRWKVDSATASDRLYVDFERVVSYDATVSADTEAEQLFAAQRQAAGLPAPTDSASGGAPGTAGPTSTATGTTPTDTTAPAPSPSSSSSPGSAAAAGAASGSGAPSSGGPSSGAPSPGATDGLQPRVLDDLGDEAFLDDRLSDPGSTAQQRTVTVAFRTSNVIVTVRYEEQPTMLGAVPDSKEMQDRARKLAAALADSLSG
ncbi:DUF3558 domain-containing protein [Streptomyces sp. MS06]|uniref:DUF3558 domain-containing protein n=1 Tax=Streptomyces sp. MS06 TaxID=3385974 RepID=UPI00399F3BA4